MGRHGTPCFISVSWSTSPKLVAPYKGRHMEPTYKLIYFNARGKAEHIRFIFAYAGIEYQDERISQDKWPDMKTKMPFGMLPVLEIDGGKHVICQSNAIARFLARRYGLAGRDEWEQLQCDMLVDTLTDIKQELFQYRQECDPLKKEEKKLQLMKEKIPFYLGKFEKIISENGGFSVGSELTWADFVFAVSLENFELIFGKESLYRYPALRELKEMVFQLPRIQAWLQKRPATDF